MGLSKPRWSAAWAVPLTPELLSMAAWDGIEGMGGAVLRQLRGL